VQRLDHACDRLGVLAVDRAEQDHVGRLTGDRRAQALAGEIGLKHVSKACGGDLVMNHLQLQRVLVALDAASSTRSRVGSVLPIM